MSVAVLVPRRPLVTGLAELPKGKERELLTLKVGTINAGCPHVLRSASLVGSCSVHITRTVRQVFSATRQ